MPWIESELTANNCPSCGRLLEAASMHAERLAEPGDYSVCAYCGSFLQITEDMRTRLLTEEDVAEMPDDLRNMLIRARKACAAWRREIANKESEP
jgi:hypothetical protein